MPCRWMIIAFSLLFIFLAAGEGAAADWRAVSDEEMRLTAADIGDPEADAAILFREGRLDDTMPEGTTLHVYLRIKIFNERGRRCATALSRRVGPHRRRQRAHHTGRRLGHRGRQP
jgi:hypothetical protein